MTPGQRRLAYPLSLAVYFSSWTFFGGVGTAVTHGWNYAAIYLGPLLLFLFAPGLLRRMVRLSNASGSSSISDFISARYGRSRSIAALVAGIALVASIPYIALQLRSVSSSFGTLVGIERSQLGGFVALLLAGFAISFGARRYEVSARNDGVIAAIASESAIKIISFTILGIFSAYLFIEAPLDLQARGLERFGTNFRSEQLTFDFLIQTLLSAAAILCLPRQFYVGVVEASPTEPRTGARLQFMLYLVIISAMVLPIALAGLAMLPADSSADLLLLQLPLAKGHEHLALIAFVGGFSAATAMVIAETIALTTMATNDLVVPLLLSSSRARAETDLGRLMLLVRRLIIVAIVGAAWLYSEAIDARWSLASIGLIAFAGVAQFAPALVATVLFDFNDARAARAGLLGGLFVWSYCLFLPSLGHGDFATVMSGLSEGVLDPRAPFGISLGSPLATGTIWSLGVNIAAMLVVTIHRRRVGLRPMRGDFGHVRTMGELKALVARFVGEAEAADSFDRMQVGPNRVGDPDAPIAADAARLAERLIAGVIGAPSARLIVTSTMAGSALDVGDVVRLLDEGGQSLQFSRGLLAATLEAIDPGVSVIDRNLRLVAWNPRYLEMFDYPEGYVTVGRPVADLIRYNAERGECGPGGVEAHVERRLWHLRRAQPHSFERRRPSGRWIKTSGAPMPGGGYVMSFTDITAEKEAQAELEARVAERTQDLARINLALDEAKTAAERATRDKTRFLAAASHDLLQPLHAARLFCAALEGDADERQRPLVRNIDRAIGSADALLRALLDVSRLDSGGVTPKVERFPLSALIEDLGNEFAALAAERGLRFASHGGNFLVETDRLLLRSILQNFLSNAVRYTARGTIWIGARRRGDAVLVEVRDSGPGIAEPDQKRIFREFERLESKGSAGGGVGLGLAIVERIARLLGLELGLRSAPGRGSTFFVRVPVVGAASPPGGVVPGTLRRASSLAGLEILCLDDEPAILEALEAALASRGCRLRLARSAAAAIRIAREERPAAALIDYQLGEMMDGLDVAAALRANDPAMGLALVTADKSVIEDPRIEALGVMPLLKPIDPAQLWRFLESVAR